MNISQVTNYDLNPYPDPEKDDEQQITFLNNEVHDNIVYREYNFDPNINVTKFGYCCENRAIPYPIFLKINGNEDYNEYHVDATGMYEFQPEIFKDANKENSEEEIVIRVTDFKVPFYNSESETKEDVEPNLGFIFKIDFAY